MTDKPKPKYTARGVIKSGPDDTETEVMIFGVTAASEHNAREYVVERCQAVARRLGLRLPIGVYVPNLDVEGRFGYVDYSRGGYQPRPNTHQTWGFGNRVWTRAKFECPITTHCTVKYKSETKGSVVTLIPIEGEKS